MRVRTSFRRASPRPADRGEAADLLRAVVLGPDLVELGGFVRALLHEPDRGADEQRELEELRLPVLHQRAGERRRDDVRPPRDRLGAVLGQIGVLGVLAGNGLRSDGADEQSEEEQRQAVVSGEPLHRGARSSLREADQDAGSAAGDDDHEIGEEHSAHAGVSYPCLTSDKRAADAGVARRGSVAVPPAAAAGGAATALLSRRVGFAEPSALADVCGGSMVGYDASVSEMSG